MPPGCIPFGLPAPIADWFWESEMLTCAPASNPDTIQGSVSRIAYFAAEPWPYVKFYSESFQEA